MSTGIVVCSECRREVHQGRFMGNYDGREWYHCEDDSAMCEGAKASYLKVGEEPKGRWCGRDNI